MTADQLDDDQVGQRLARILETRASSIEVRDDWEAVARRLRVPDRAGAGRSPSGAARRRRRLLGDLALGIGVIGVAAALVVAVVFGWRPAVLTPQPVGPAANVPLFAASIPTLVVYRTTAGTYPEKAGQQEQAQSAFTITPERVRTDSPAIGRAALEALFETSPVQPGNVNWLEQRIPQKADVTSVTVSGDLIRVELNAFSSQVFGEPEAYVMAQAWVRTLQDTLGVRDDVLITLQGRPFWLYGVIDTAQPLARDESVKVVRPDGFDSPRAGDVVPRTFALLGSVTPGIGQLAHILVVDLDSGRTAYRQDFLGPSDRAAPVDLEPVLTLAPGRYRATMTSQGAVGGVRDVTFTVVS